MANIKHRRYEDFTSKVFGRLAGGLYHKNKEAIEDEESK